LNSSLGDGRVPGVDAGDLVRLEAPERVVVVASGPGETNLTTTRRGRGGRRRRSSGGRRGAGRG
jgi:hypothetical protein